MKIFIEVEEAAERLEELIDLALQQDEIWGGRPVAQLTSFSGANDDTPSDEFAETLTGAGLTAAGELPR
ncbi:hypothetical protein MYG64_22530 (plasmid) [Ensifer adhaerens]|uniref:hypothetical protein n=1 Tax=Ensifer adhaerens TaxID=106592 RepID=UPI002100E767|nr:hypothetical protein [Ensifer adhaerens]UTV40015.1 hypothetical protein MYG64_22530 [Ensifer adhaerens]